MIRRFIGDVHGKFSRYKTIIEDSQDTIQVGDMGVGFVHYGGDKHRHFSSNPPYEKMKAGNHRFIRGNHDNPHVCKKHSQYIPDGTIEGNMMFVGGALSVDKAWRTIDYDYWVDEELSQPELYQLMDAYEAAKPDIMVTHDCPEWVAQTMESISGRQKLGVSSRTRQAFGAFYGLHQPRVWIYGHWHFSFDEVIGKTRFICLNELEVKDVEV